MNLIRPFATLGLLVLLSACSVPTIATRNAPFEPLPAGTAMPQPTPAVAAPDLPDLPGHSALPERPAPVAPAVAVVDYAITVPKDLTVSEANLYYPLADIVWRGDPRGNRKAQVAYLFEAGVKGAQARLHGARGVKVEIEVKRFHSITEKTRYTVGGVHNMVFFLTVSDAQTGAALVERREVTTDLNAFGGKRALEAEAQGLTMKARVTAHLARVIAAELTLPGGWQDFDTRLAEATDAI